MNHYDVMYVGCGERHSHQPGTPLEAQGCRHVRADDAVSAEADGGGTRCGQRRP